MRFAFIAAEKAQHTLSLLCRCMQVTRSGFYAWVKRSPSTRAQRDAVLKVQVRAAFEASGGSYGSPRILRDLREADELVSRKRVIRLMQADGLKARVRKRFKQTTMSDHDEPVAPNLLNRQFTAEAPNQRWVGDTTEFVISEGGGKLYLAALLDLYSRAVVGWAIGPRNDRQLTIAALEMALARRLPAAGLLHHTDRGSTYASADYQAVLTAQGLTCSMSRRGNCHDNAVAEAFFSSLKSELADRFANRDQADRELFRYIEAFYNPRRRHSSIGYVSPAAYERAYAMRETPAIVPAAVIEGMLQPGMARDDQSWGVL